MTFNSPTEHDSMVAHDAKAAKLDEEIANMRGRVTAHVLTTDRILGRIRLKTSQIRGNDENQSG